ncbi:hypothetical protein BSLG_005749 [Batrachochytrium salamandrivorans]|nr:hypothetical protein BSLG_005749 [Batrachochytrium salamandrivorans]
MGRLCYSVTGAKTGKYYSVYETALVFNFSLILVNYRIRFHGVCLGLTDKQVDSLSTYCCADCDGTEWPKYLVDAATSPAGKAARMAAVPADLYFTSPFSYSASSIVDTRQWIVIHHSDNCNQSICSHAFKRFIFIHHKWNAISKTRQLHYCLLALMCLSSKPTKLSKRKKTQIYSTDTFHFCANLPIYLLNLYFTIVNKTYEAECQPKRAKSVDHTASTSSQSSIDPLRAAFLSHFTATFRDIYEWAKTHKEELGEPLHASIQLDDYNGMAKKVEQALFDTTHILKNGVRVVSDQYKAKFRSLRYNLMDVTNTRLRKRILLSGKQYLDADALVRLSPDELGNEEMKKQPTESNDRTDTLDDLIASMNGSNAIRDTPIISNEEKKLKPRATTNIAVTSGYGSDYEEQPLSPFDSIASSSDDEPSKKSTVSSLAGNRQNQPPQGLISNSMERNDRVQSYLHGRTSSGNGVLVVVEFKSTSNVDQPTAVDGLQTLVDYFASRDRCAVIGQHLAAVKDITVNSAKISTDIPSVTTAAVMVLPTLASLSTGAMPQVHSSLTGLLTSISKPTTSTLTSNLLPTLSALPSLASSTTSQTQSYPSTSSSIPQQPLARLDISALSTLLPSLAGVGGMNQTYQDVQTLHNLMTQAGLHFHHKTIPVLHGSDRHADVGDAVRGYASTYHHTGGHRGDRNEYRGRGEGIGIMVEGVEVNNLEGTNSGYHDRYHGNSGYHR